LNKSGSAALAGQIFFCNSVFKGFAGLTEHIRIYVLGPKHKKACCAKHSGG